MQTQQTFTKECLEMNLLAAQPEFTCSKLTIETLQQVVLVSLLLTLNM